MIYHVSLRYIVVYCPWLTLKPQFRRVQVAVDDTSPEEMESRARAHQELVDGFWAATQEQAGEVPLPGFLEQVGFESVTLPRVELSAEMKKDQQKMVG